MKKIVSTLVIIIVILSFILTLLPSLFLVHTRGNSSEESEEGAVENIVIENVDTPISEVNEGDEQ